MKNYTITVNGTAYQVTVEEGDASQVTAPVAAPAKVAAPAPVKAAAPVASGNAGSIKVDAPMPGTILDIKTNVGASVNAGDVLLVLEAMKMENEIVAPEAGKVASINVNKGDSVEAGKVLVTLS